VDRRNSLQDSFRESEAREGTGIARSGHLLDDPLEIPTGLKFIGRKGTRTHPKTGPEEWDDRGGVDRGLEANFVKEAPQRNIVHVPGFEGRAMNLHGDVDSRVFFVGQMDLAETTPPKVPTKPIMRPLGNPPPHLV
jgi:hypothetical protein